MKRKEDVILTACVIAMIITIIISTAVIRAQLDRIEAMARATTGACSIIYN